MKTLKFVLLKQTWKGQKVIRHGPSRTTFRIILNKSIPGGLLHYAMDHNTITNKKAIGYFKPCPDKNALIRGTKKENTAYLKPKLGNFWNDTKNTPTSLERLDSGTAIMLINNDSFKKILFNGKLFKAMLVFKRQDKTDLWSIEKSIGPGKKIKNE